SSSSTPLTAVGIMEVSNTSNLPTRPRMLNRASSSHASPSWESSRAGSVRSVVASPCTAKPESRDGAIRCFFTIFSDAPRLIHHSHNAPPGGPDQLSDITVGGVVFLGLPVRIGGTMDRCPPEVRENTVGHGQSSAVLPTLILQDDGLNPGV